MGRDVNKNSRLRNAVRYRAVGAAPALSRVAEHCLNHFIRESKENIHLKSSFTKQQSNYSQTGLESSPIRPSEQITGSIETSLNLQQDAS